LPVADDPTPGIIDADLDADVVVPDGETAPPRPVDDGAGDRDAGVRP